MGIIRLFLALAVVGAHTGFSFPVGGREAVLLFFMISGFYMAMILNEKYVGPGSTWRFYKSRYLKLWIPFVFVIIFFLAVAYITNTPTLLNYIDSFPLWLSVATCFSNLFIFGQDLIYLFSFDGQYRLSYLPYGMPGWNGNLLAINLVIFTISLELYFYLLAPFILRSFARVVVFTLIGFLWFAWLMLSHYDGIDLKYHLFPSAFLFFGLGSSAYWINQTEKSPKNLMGQLVIFAILMLLPWISLLINGVIVILFFFSIATVFNLSKNSSMDRVLGELSYPVYLVHLPIISLLPLQFKGHLFAWTVLFALLAAAIMYRTIEKPLNIYRMRFARG